MTRKDISKVESARSFTRVEEYGCDWIMTGASVLSTGQAHSRCLINVDRLTARTVILLQFCMRTAGVSLAV